MLRWKRDSKMIEMQLLHVTYLLMDPLPRTPNRFLAPLLVLTPPLNRKDINEKAGDSMILAGDEGTSDDVGKLLELRATVGRISVLESLPNKSDIVSIVYVSRVCFRGLLRRLGQ